MWIKLLKKLHFEDRRFCPGTILWLRRTGKIINKDGKYSQDCSVATVECDGFVLLLPDDAENDLYEQTVEPPSGYQPKTYTDIPGAFVI
jgi:hypothetical protein